MSKYPIISFPPALLPALRARMGDRWYYLATMTFRDIASAVQRVADIHEKDALKTWIQRELRPERTQQIVGYLISQHERFFNALVLGVYQGEPEWRPINVSSYATDAKLEERQATSFGLIHLSGNESIFAIDGQHRVEGIRVAVKEDPKLNTEEQAVIMIAHKTDERGRSRTRRLFSTLNGYARPVAESELVALSEDDAFAIATRNLIDNYPGLGIHFVPLLPSANIPAHEKTAVTTVVGLYHLTQALAPAEIRQQKRKHKVGPSKPETVAAIEEAVAAFWNALQKHVLAIREVLNSKPSESLAANYRTDEGGNLLFRTVGLNAFAKATRTLMDRGDSADAAVKRLAKVPLNLNSSLWTGVFWRPETNTMLTKYVSLAHNIFLHEVGVPPAKRKLNVEQEYKRVTGNQYPK